MLQMEVHAVARFTDALHRPATHSRQSLSARSPEVALYRPCVHGSCTAEPAGQ